MTNNNPIIQNIQNNLKIYKYISMEKSFILEKDDDIQKHPLVFDDIKLITQTLQKNKVLYYLNEHDLSITMKI